jgi:hypothetical protein
VDAVPVAADAPLSRWRQSCAGQMFSVGERACKMGTICLCTAHLKVLGLIPEYRRMLADVYSVTVGAMYAIGRAIRTAVIPSNSTFNGFHDHVGFAAGLYPHLPSRCP